MRHLIQHPWLVALVACALAPGCGLTATDKDAATGGSFATLGVTAEEVRMAGIPPGPRRRGKYGDILLSNGLRAIPGAAEAGPTPTLHAVLERADRPSRLKPPTGKLIDLWAPGGDDLLGKAGAAIVFGAAAAVEVDYSPAERVPSAGSTPPFVRARGTALSADGAQRIDVTTEYRMKSAEPLVRVTHTAHNPGAVPLTVNVCEAAYVGNHPLWMPGRGTLREKAAGAAPWIGVEALGNALALAPPSGDAYFYAKVVSIHEARFYSGLLACPSEAPQTIPPGGALTVEWLWSASAIDLAAAAGAVLGARGMALVTANGSVATPPQPEGAPSRLMYVDLVRDGKPHARARVVAGRWSALLPSGAFAARVVGHGRADGPLQTFTVAAAVPLGGIDLAAAGAGIIRITVTKAGDLLPARIFVLGDAGPASPGVAPMLGPIHRSDGAGNSVYTLDGTAVVAVPPGRYRIRASRGLEYTMPEATAVVEAGKSASVNLAIATAVETDDAVACDFHLHAIGSRDSDVALADRVVSLIAEGMEFAVATDHNRLTNYEPVLEELGVKLLLRTAIGEEISTHEPKTGHFNVFPFPVVTGEHGDRIALDPVRAWKTTPGEVFASVREVLPKDEIIQVNHPRMEPRIGYFELMGLDPTTGTASNSAWSGDFDTIEVFNGLELAHLDVVETNLRDWYALLNLGERKTATGNSDSHHLWLHEVGYPRTYLFIDGVDLPTEIRLSAVVAALRAGRAMVTSGPFLRATVGGGDPGDMVKLEKGSVKVGIGVQAAPWVDVSRFEVVLNGKTVATGPLEVRDGEARAFVDVPITEDSWIVVLVRGEKPYSGVLAIEGVVPLAFQNPVWIDADGDGAWTPPAPR